MNPLLFGVLLAAAGPAPADLILTRGAVYTVDPARSWAEAVAIRGGRIVYVGTDLGVKPYRGPRSRVVDLGGRMLLPGFQDAHVHPVTSGIQLGQCDLSDLPAREALLAKVATCAEGDPRAPWIQGAGWLMSSFPGGIPTRDALDAIAPDRPVYLESADGHSAWVNSRALALAGITRDTPDPANGRIERDPATGEAVGTLQESATDLVSRLTPEPSLDVRLAGLGRALRKLNAWGLTALQEANAGGGPKGGGRSILETYQAAERRGTLSARVTVALGTDAARGPEQVDDLVRLRREFMGRRVRPTAAKIFADGVLESHTAAMLAPYLDRPGESGRPTFEPQALDALVTRLAGADFDVHIHAIGDRAVRISLDALEAAAAPATRTRRHQIAHLELVQPEDVPRFRRLGVIANFQPLWGYADDYITDLTWPLIGPERSRRLYPIGELARSGAVVAFGSDWSVSSANPLEGIQVAVTRESVSAPRRPPLLPEQAIDLPTALAAYTIGAAYANRLDAETGSIEVGKAADLVVLSKNVFEVDPHEIADVKVVLTLLEGQAVYQDPAWAW